MHRIEPQTKRPFRACPSRHGGPPRHGPRRDWSTGGRQACRGTGPWGPKGTS